MECGYGSERVLHLVLARQWAMHAHGACAIPSRRKAAAARVKHAILDLPIGGRDNGTANGRGPRPQRRLHLRPLFRQDGGDARLQNRSEEHTSELQSLTNLVCRLLLEKKKNQGDTKPCEHTQVLGRRSP